MTYTHNMNVSTINQTDSTRSDSTQSQSATNHYYISYPRNFGTEYTVFVANTPEAIAWCEARREEAIGDSNSTFDRITRKHAAYRGIRAVREHTRDSEAGYSVDLFLGGLYTRDYGIALRGRSDGAVFRDSAAELATAVKRGEI